MGKRHEEKIVLRQRHLLHWLVWWFFFALGEMAKCAEVYYGDVGQRFAKVTPKFHELFHGLNQVRRLRVAVL